MAKETMRNLLTAAALALGASAVPGIAYSRWDELLPIHKAQFLQLTDKQLAFVKTRHSKSGLFCCDDADGYQPEKEDITWDMQTGKYRVKLRGEWTDVSDDAKLDDANIIGRPIVWVLPSFYNSELTPTQFRDQYGTNPIRCFLPGPEL